MVLPFRRSGHRFVASPLSLAVPLEGSEAVVGLRELQRRKDSNDLARALNLDGLGGLKPKRPWRQRYGGPYLRQLTLADVKAVPKAWGSFFLEYGWNTYNVPASLDHLCERAEENLVASLPNYLRLLLVLLLAALCMRPWSLVGALALAGLVTLKLTSGAPKDLRELPFRQRFWVILERQLRDAQAAVLVQEQQATPTAPVARIQPERDASAPGIEATRAGLQLLAYALMVYCNTIGRVVRAVWWWAWLVAVHSCLRRSPAEVLEAARRLGRAPDGTSSSCDPCVPGVAVSQVLGLASTAAGADPRRVFREALQLAAGVASAAGAYCWHAAQFRGHEVWARLRGFAMSTSRRL